MCEGFKWNHMPVAGGIYDQNPDIIDRFYFIMVERSKQEAKEQAQRDNEMGRGRGSTVAQRARRR